MPNIVYCVEQNLMVMEVLGLYVLIYCLSITVGEETLTNIARCYAKHVRRKY